MNGGTLPYSRLRSSDTLTPEAGKAGRTAA
jgi:hypothetical protein